MRIRRNILMTRIATVLSKLLVPGSLDSSVSLCELHRCQTLCENESPQQSIHPRSGTFWQKPLCFQGSKLTDIHANTGNCQELETIIQSQWQLGGWKEKGIFTRNYSLVTPYQSSIFLRTHPFCPSTPAQSYRVNCPVNPGKGNGRGCVEPAVHHPHFNHPTPLSIRAHGSHLCRQQSWGIIMMCLT